MYPVCILPAHVVCYTYQVACNIQTLVHVVTKKTCLAQLRITDLTAFENVHVFLSIDTLNTRRAHKKPNISRQLRLNEASCTDTVCIYISQCTLHSIDVAKTPAH